MTKQRQTGHKLPVLREMGFDSRVQVSAAQIALVSNSPFEKVLGRRLVESKERRLSEIWLIVVSGDDFGSPVAQRIGSIKPRE
ncbi:hypothetical protein WL11_16800 [Burkholderia ubonensis]|nr:hypothetical protein WL11_16800 [Burkholderia ubonensis]